MNDTSNVAQLNRQGLPDEAAAARFARDYVVSAGVPAWHHRIAREHAARWFRLHACQPGLRTGELLEGSLARVFAGYGERD